MRQPLTEADKDARAVIRLVQRGLITDIESADLCGRILAMQAKVERAVKRQAKKARAVK